MKATNPNNAFITYKTPNLYLHNITKLQKSKDLNYFLLSLCPSYKLTDVIIINNADNKYHSSICTKNNAENRQKSQYRYQRQY